MDEYKSSEVFIELADAKSIEAFIDDAVWEGKLNTIVQAIGNHKVGGGIFIHPGMEPRPSSGVAPATRPSSGVAPATETGSSRDAAVRRSAALLLRMLELIAKFRSQDLHFVLIIPWAKGSDNDIRNHGIAKEIQTIKASGFDLDDVAYQVVSDISACHDQENLDACLRTAIQAINLGPIGSGVAPAPAWEQVVSSGVTPATGRLPESTSLSTDSQQNQVNVQAHPEGSERHDEDGEPAHDLLRQRVEQPYQLAGKSNLTDRRKAQPPSHRRDEESSHLPPPSPRTPLGRGRRCKDHKRLPGR